MRKRPGADGAPAKVVGAQAAGVIGRQAWLVGTGEAMLVAAEPGFEPGLEDPKSPVLPLHNSAGRVEL